MTPITEFTGALNPDQATVIREMAALCRDHDGAPPVSDHNLIKLDNPELANASRITHLVIKDDNGGESAVAAYAIIDQGDTQEPTATVEMMVHPRARRRGLGSLLITHARNLVEVQGQHLNLWSHGDLTAAREVALSAGLREIRELWQMRRELTEPLPAVEVPAMWRLAEFRPGVDDAAWLSLNASAFSYHPEQGRVSATDLQALRAEPWFDPAGFFLLFSAESHPNLPDAVAPLAGFVWTKIHPAAGQSPALGEIYVIGVNPEHQGQGLGKLLTRQALHYLTARGLTVAMLYVEGNNAAAIRLYSGLGFTRHTVDVMYTTAPA